MRKKNGDHYKENVVKTMWNITTKLIQEKYIKYGREIYPFYSDSKRKLLQSNPDKIIFCCLSI